MTTAKNKTECTRCFEGGTLQVLYEDEYIAVMYKPAGLLSVPYEGCTAKTALSVLESRMRKAGTYAKNHRPFAVHRLDRDTSGVMMAALSEKAQKTIMNGWQTLVTERTYRAVAENSGGAAAERGVIDAQLAYNAYNMAFVPQTLHSGNGKRAVKTVSARTHYTVVTRGKTHTLFELSLETGRKNQIRAHLAFLKFPIAGDKNYRAATNPFGRLMLHARTLAFTHPFTGERMKFEVPEPETWQRFVECGENKTTDGKKGGRQQRKDGSAAINLHDVRDFSRKRGRKIDCIRAEGSIPGRFLSRNKKH